MMTIKILKMVLLLLLTTGLHAKNSKWHTLKPLYAYRQSPYVLKKGVDYLELREYTRTGNTKEEMQHIETAFVMRNKALKNFPSSKVKKFKSLTPVMDNKTNIRKFTYCDHSGCVEHVGNGFMIASDGRLWKMNEIADVWNYIEKINTPAKIQLALWLQGKDQGVRYRKVKNGYEVIVEKYRTSNSYEEHFVYSVHVDYNGKVTNEKLLKHSKRRVQCVRKPAIYLYPKKRQHIDVSLKINGRITLSIPSYGKGWHVTVDSNGTIENRYDYLFYENTLRTIVLPKEGWIKRGDALDAWFDVILPKLGLNIKETEQFKAYWLERLNRHTLYEIKLFSRSFLSENMTLTIDPKPDTLIRVIFHFKNIKKPYKLEEPTITTPKRAGFHVLEWGGVLEEEKK